ADQRRQVRDAGTATHSTEAEDCARCLAYGQRGRGELMVKVVGSWRPAGEVAIAISDRPDGLEVCLNGCADDQHANCPTSDPAGNILSVLEGQGQLAETKPLPALRPRSGC